MDTNETNIREYEGYDEKIIAKYTKIQNSKGELFDLDKAYTPIALADFKIIPTFRGIPACHQYIRKIARTGDLESTSDGSTTYQKRLIKGIWALDYLKKHNLL